jgi:hypothetical protein
METQVTVKGDMGRKIGTDTSSSGTHSCLHNGTQQLVCHLFRPLFYGITSYVANIIISLGAEASLTDPTAPAEPVKPAEGQGKDKDKDKDVPVPKGGYKAEELDALLQVA